jgi:hypothetical protein
VQVDNEELGEPDPYDASFEGHEDNGFEDADIDKVPHHNNVLKVYKKNA